MEVSFLSSSFFRNSSSFSIINKIGSVSGKFLAFSSSIKHRLIKFQIMLQRALLIILFSVVLGINEKTYSTNTSSFIWFDAKFSLQTDSLIRNDSTLGREIEREGTLSNRVDTAQSTFPDSADTGEQSSQFLTFILSIVAILVTLIAAFWKKVKRAFTLNYQRYLENLRTVLEKEKYEDFPELKLIDKTVQDGKAKYTFSEIMSSGNSIHLQGKPGSGKTSIVKKYALQLCSGNSRIPIYVEYRGESLFNQILHTLHVNKLVYDRDLIDENWLKKEFSKQKFLIIIDDIHNFLTDEKKKESSKILDLLDYNVGKVKFVLISRDSYKLCPFKMPLFEIEDLSKNPERAKQVLKAHVNESKASRVWYHLGNGHNTKLMQLYNTPQLLKLYAIAYNEQERFNASRSLLFERFFKYRDENEVKKNSQTLPLNFKKRVLGFLAYNLFISKQETPYSVAYPEFRKILSQGINAINTEFGYKFEVDDVEQELYREGHLLNYESRIQFEHHQWQEFFAAEEILERKYSVASVLNDSYGREIALFISGFYSPEKYLKEKEYWGDFWENILMVDYFLMSECNQAKPSFSMADFDRIFEEFIYDNDDLRLAYSYYLELYERVINLHFPSLLTEFFPNGKEKTGLLVENNDQELQVLFGFRPVNQKNPEKVIILNRKEALKVSSEKNYSDPIEYYFHYFKVQNLHSNALSAVHAPPVMSAYQDIQSQLTKIVEYGNLIETDFMKQEAIFAETVSLSKMIKGKQGSISNTSNQDVLSIGELLIGIESFKKRDYLPSIQVPIDDSFRGLKRHEISLNDYELKLKSHIQKNNLSSDYILKRPNSDLVDVIKKYRVRKDELSSVDRDFLIKRSEEYFKNLFSNYKQVIKQNFPTAKEKFLSYSATQIFLILENTRRKEHFGRKLIYYNPELNGSEQDVKISIETENDLSDLKEQYRGFIGWNVYWGLKSFHKIEPIRSAVYELLREDFKKLNRN